MSQIGNYKNCHKCEMRCDRDFKYYEEEEKFAKIKNSINIEFCEWEQEDLMDIEYNNWATKCGNMISLVEGTPKKNAYRFCPFCGAIIKEMPDSI